MQMLFNKTNTVDHISIGLLQDPNINTIDFPDNYIVTIITIINKHD